MPSTNFNDVGHFHEKFGLDNVTHHGAHPRSTPPGLMHLKISHLQEELNEFIKARIANDHAGMVDALVDLVYVAMGTAHVLGYPWQEVWADVHSANMTKVRAAEDGSDSKRLSGFDVVKPPDFVPPDPAAILRRHGWAV
jgi:predicted HAD superfamily Cof-like phosphohydrolase